MITLTCIKLAKTFGKGQNVDIMSETAIPMAFVTEFYLSSNQSDPNQIDLDQSFFNSCC